MNTKWKRKLRAQLRDARVLFNESKGSLFLLIVLVMGGAFILRSAYAYPETGESPEYFQAVYSIFTMIFFATDLPFPQIWYLQIFFFLVPILGLLVIADGVLRFGTALINKQARGQKWQVAMASTYQNHIIVCGFGKVGYRVTCELLKFGREVVAIEQDPDAVSLSAPKIWGLLY